MSHTADLRLRVFGKNEEELFSNALQALAVVIKKDAKRLFRKKTRASYEKIKVKGQGWNELLINFLNDIIAQSNINKKIYPRVNFLKFSPAALEANLLSVPVESFDEDVKAVTYHGGEIVKNDEGFLETTLTLDI